MFIYPPPPLNSQTQKLPILVKAAISNDIESLCIKKKCYYDKKKKKKRRE